MFGDRLKLARKKAGYSLRGLSDALGGAPSAQGIGKYERGEMMPNSGVLLQMAKVLDVSLVYLFSEQVEKLEAIEFRKKSGTSSRDRARVEAAVIDVLQRYFAIEEILGLDDDAWRISRLGNRFLGREEDGELLARDLRRKWELGIGPIPNVTSLLEERGVKVLVTPLPDSVSGLTCLVRRPRHRRKEPVIIVNERFSLERRRFTLAHELAHRLIDGTSPVDHEKAADVFAGEFLVPSEHLLHGIGNHRNALVYQELIQLKRMYRVGAAMLLVRLQQVGIINQSALTYAFQTFARRWRKIEPEPLESVGDEGKCELPRRFERLCYWALAEKLIGLAKVSELLQKPLAEIEQGRRGPALDNADYR